MSLNKAQKEAVSHKEGPCLVLAGPGSGKTLTIAKRIEYLITMYKVRPEEILVITFTKYAATEMRERFRKIMGAEGLPVTFGTFHSIYYGILKWAYGFNQTNFLPEEEKYAILKEIAASQEWEDCSALTEDEDFIIELAEAIGKIKNNRYNIDTFQSCKYGITRFREIYHIYEETKKRERKIDFDDMLVLCCELFEKRSDILEKWQKKFRYILVDEFQDINQVQYDVIRMLAAPENNLFVVGDDDQSVYRFRGARPEIMLDFMKDYPDARKIVLNINYRSTAHIVNGASRVIGHNKSRYKKDIKTYQAAEETVHVQEVKDMLEESKYILSKYEEYTCQGVAPEKMAVLYRTASDARVLAETFMEYQVPFQMKEHIDHIYEHFICMDMASYFRLALNQYTRKDMLQIGNRPKRYLGRDSMGERTVTYESLRNFYCDKEWMQDRIDQLEWDMKMIRNKTPYAAIQYIRKSIGYDEFLKEYAAYRGLDKEELIQTLEEIQERARGCHTLKEWLSHIESYKEILQKKKRERGTGCGIQFLTMHGAKGLEYEVVFIIEGNEGVIPYKKAKLEEEIEEERRLFYVAMTRAKRKLIISYVKEKNGKSKSPSRFVNELFVTA